MNTLLNYEFLCKFNSYSELENALDVKYPNSYKLEGGVLCWTGSGKYYIPKKKRVYDIVIDADLKIYVHPLDLIVMKGRQFYNPRRFSIAVCGMRGINSYIWREFPYSTLYRNMVSSSQVDLMCWISSYLSFRYSIPIIEIKTRPEYQEFAPPDMKLKIYPYFWDFEGHGDLLRRKINEYLLQRL